MTELWSSRTGVRNRTAADLNFANARIAGIRNVQIAGDIEA